MTVTRRDRLHPPVTGAIAITREDAEDALTHGGVRLQHLVVRASDRLLLLYVAYETDGPEGLPTLPHTTDDPGRAALLAWTAVSNDEAPTHPAFRPAMAAAVSLAVAMWEVHVAFWGV